jgi:uncharacterized protein
MTDNSEIRVESLHTPSEITFRPTPTKRGFAAMDATRQRNIASKGGSSVPIDKRSFSRDRELAVAAGRKGGQARMLAAMRRKALAAAEPAAGRNAAPPTIGAK